MNYQLTIMMLVSLLVISCSRLQVSESIESRSVASTVRESLQKIIGNIEITDASGYDAVNFIFDNTTFDLDNRVIVNNSTNRVTLSQNKATIYDLLNEICRQAHLEWLIDGQRVIVKDI